MSGLFKSLFQMRVLFFPPSTRLFLQQGIHLSLSQSDLMDLAWDARATPGSWWLAAFMAVIESECLKSWHFTSARHKMTGFVHVFVCRLLPVSPPLPQSYPLSVSHFTSFHLYSFHFSGSFINLTCDSINLKLKGIKWISSTSEQ